MWLDGGVFKEIKISPLPLEQENNNEEKESKSNSAKPVPEEERPRSGGAKGGSNTPSSYFFWNREIRPRFFNKIPLLSPRTP